MEVNVLFPGDRGKTAKKANFIMDRVFRINICILQIQSAIAFIRQAIVDGGV